MADAVTTQVLYESASEYVAKFTNISDGTGESAVVKVDVSALSPACAEVDILKVMYMTNGLQVRILWDASTDVPAMILTESHSDEFDFRDYPGGRIRNNSGSGKTGDVLFTTLNHSTGDGYTVILWCRKLQTAEL